MTQLEANLSQHGANIRSSDGSGPWSGQVGRSGDGSGQVTGPAHGQVRWSSQAGGQVRQVVRSGRWSGRLEVSGRQGTSPSFFYRYVHIRKC